MQDTQRQANELLDALIQSASAGRELTLNEQFTLLLTANQIISDRLAQIVSAKISTENLTEALSSVSAGSDLTEAILKELSRRIPKDKLAHAYVLGVIHSNET